jgi:hypothetical protein
MCSTVRRMTVVRPPIHQGTHIRQDLAEFNDASSQKTGSQPTEPHTRAIFMSKGLRACVQGSPFWPWPFFANHENMVQANFMLRAVARWRAPDARNSNKSLLMPAADPHVNCRCAYHGVCLSTTALPVGEGFAAEGFRIRAHQPSRVKTVHH